MTAATSKLMLKSMPCTMSEFGDLIQELSLITPRSLNAFGRRRMIIEYADAAEAQTALEQLLGLSDILDKPLRVCPFGPKDQSDDGAKSSKANKCVQASVKKSSPSTSQPEIHKYVQKLYASNNECDFLQPPPPYLRYAYPPVNADILSAIGDALLRNKRFYTQVLHLMNRMNLPAPFGPQAAGLHLKVQQSQSVATQTDVLASETESELESDVEHDQQHQQQQHLQLKRPAASLAPEKYRKRVRQLLQQAASQPSKSTAIQEKTETSKNKIELKLPKVLPTVDQELPKQRMPPEQLETLPVYKNYKTGEPSHKLYIKNLDKSVTEPQLRAIYARYGPAESLEIKVMQQGRMKGQAFVTFPQAESAVVVAQALVETNGLIWQEKPMIVCYGKQQQ
ncbi:hypothetical protein KR093_006858 [Drosophila rubida]|uniref:RRM domain-containing protein n=1 Tax=Drosophila rubida TaxID=30044 RepID=A0AAD4JR89_9MUSC|nr:hypothetical protein KR093_006858 [Drosophila rubida]